MQLSARRLNWVPLQPLVEGSPGFLQDMVNLLQGLSDGWEDQRLGRQEFQTIQRQW